MLTAAGLLDFADAMTTLHLLASHDPARHWYLHGPLGINRAIRLISISIALIAGIVARPHDDPTVERNPATIG